jgi:hypothetical protein
MMGLTHLDLLTVMTTSSHVAGLVAEVKVGCLASRVVEIDFSVFPLDHFNEFEIESPGERRGGEDQCVDRWGAVCSLDRGEPISETAMMHDWELDGEEERGSVWYSC